MALLRHIVRTRQDRYCKFSSKHSCFSNRWIGSWNKARVQIQDVLKNYRDLSFSPLRIKECSFEQSFSSAAMKYEDICVDEKGNICDKEETVCSHRRDDLYLPEIDLRTLYRSTFESLNKFVEEGCMPEGPYLCHAESLVALNAFLANKEFNIRCMKDGKERSAFFSKDQQTVSEVNVAVLLTNHLLSKLVVGNNYLINSDYNNKPYLCPCLTFCGHKVSYGNTGLGSEKVWYGNPDVVLSVNDNLKQYVELTQSEIIQDSQEESSAEENKRVYLNEEERSSASDAFIDLSSQMIKQTIVFSYHQAIFKRRNPHLELPDVTLIPSLLITQDKYHIFMYDHKHDIFLSSGHNPGKLWDDTEYNINMSAVLHIWMVLNHMNLFPSLNENLIKHFENSCYFHDKLPCHVLEQITDDPYVKKTRHDSKLVNRKKFK